MWLNGGGGEQSEILPNTGACNKCFSHKAHPPTHLGTACCWCAPSRRRGSCPACPSPRSRRAPAPRCCCTAAATRCSRRPGPTAASPPPGWSPRCTAASNAACHRGMSTSHVILQNISQSCLDLISVPTNLLNNWDLARQFVWMAFVGYLQVELVVACHGGVVECLDDRRVRVL